MDDISDEERHEHSKEDTKKADGAGMMEVCLIDCYGDAHNIRTLFYSFHNRQGATEGLSLKRNKTVKQNQPIHVTVYYLSTIYVI